MWLFLEAGWNQPIAPPNLPGAEPPAALTWQEVTSPGPAIHLRGRGQVRSPGRNLESQFPGRGRRSRPAGILDPALGRARAGTGCFRPHGAEGGGRGGVGRTECAGARAQGKRRRPARRVGEGSSRKPGRPGVPPPGLPGSESVGHSGFRHLGGGSLKAFRILECQHWGISDLVSATSRPWVSQTFRNRRTVASGFPGS